MWTAVTAEDGEPGCDAQEAAAAALVSPVFQRVWVTK